MNILLSDEQFTELYNYLTSAKRFGAGPDQGAVSCDHTLAYTIKWMKERQVRNITANVEKLIDLGGHCDCEVLLNVNPATWLAFRDEDITGPDFMGEQGWRQFVSGLLLAGGYEESRDA